jgi:pimeloyl-ACP methyl ester carboxylesterase
MMMPVSRRAALVSGSALLVPAGAAAQPVPGAAAAAPLITRHFVTIGDRQVHYRRAGSGPPVFVLHASPGSSASMVTLIGRLASRFTVIAPDTPGNGLSEPLPLPDPSMADYADALAGLMTALGIARAGIYGSFTGAGCALEMARRHPDRASVAIVNGYLHFTEEERSEIIANYLPVFQPDWYGGHLVWAWARLREQTIFFPWFHKDDASRMLVDQGPPAGLHAGVVDLLRSGDNYRKPYRAAFKLDYGRAVLEAKAPTLITTSQQDVMWPQWTRMPPPPPTVTARGTATRDESWNLAVEALARYPGAAATPAPVKTAPRGGTWAEMVQVGGDNIYLRRTAGPGRPILVIHPPGGSSLGLDPLLRAFAGRRAALAVDLPGQGESTGANGVTVAAAVGTLTAVLDGLKISQTDVVGWSEGSVVATAFAAAHPKRVGALVLPEVFCPDQAERELLRQHPPPDLTPKEHGTHFLEAWNYIRDLELWRPWRERVASRAVRGRDPRLEPVDVHQRMLDLMKAKDSIASISQEHLAYPVETVLGQIGTRVILGSPTAPATTRAQAMLQRARVTVTEFDTRDPHRFADTLVPALGRK